MLRPRALVWVSSLATFTEISGAIDPRHWDVHKAIGAVPTLSDTGNRYPDLIIARADDAAGALADPVNAIRACADGLAQAPVVLLGKHAAGMSAGGSAEPDGYLDADAAGPSFRTSLDDWIPAPNGVLDRLIETFGHDQIANLTRSFRDFLIESVPKLTTDEAPHIAHRVAGLAGTLGFSDLGAAWSAVSDSVADIAAVRRLSRMAIYEISRKFA